MFVTSQAKYNGAFIKSNCNEAPLIFAWLVTNMKKLGWQLKKYGKNLKQMRKSEFYKKKL